MSWGDYYRRRDAIDLVLTRARHHRAAGRPFDELDTVPDAFADREELALALQYKWSQLLTGRVAVALADAGQAADVDHVDAVATAWRTTARTNPELRALLDGYVADAGPTFLETQRYEQRMVALAAGLADGTEPTDETTRIGAAFLGLVRGRPEHATRTGSSCVEQLFRRLVASGS